MRAWSAITFSAMSVRSSRPSVRPVIDCAVSTSAARMSVSNTEYTPLTAARFRSSPAPVSTLRRGRSSSAAVGAAEVLREHEVPDLDVAVLRGRVGGAGVGTVLRAVVPEDLRARTARTDVAHLPEVVLVEPLDARPREADLVGPDLLGLVVADVHGDPDAVAVEPQHLGEELPRPRDRVALEVVAEAPVAEHLEEAEMARRPADGVEVVVLAAGPHALLHVDHPRRVVRDRLLAEEVRDELHHPRVREHRRRRVVRDQAGRGHERVLPRATKKSRNARRSS